MFSFRNYQHRWSSSNQRSELWNLYNTRVHKGESVRAFPLSNWTELDISLYTHTRKDSHRALVPCRAAARGAARSQLDRRGRRAASLQPGEVPQRRMFRFRTLGCYLLTGAIESTATTLEGIIGEMMGDYPFRTGGAHHRHDATSSMEAKK
ncbi:phosphoadenosine phosphosulfate reductase domain-containing protein [Xanthomonas axonopodis]